MHHRLSPVVLGLSLSLGMASACRTADKGDLGSPDNGDGDRDDSTGEGDGASAVDQWLGDLGCPYEEEPTAFTGDLVWLAKLAPDGGEVSWEPEGSRVTSFTGEVDWEAGVATLTASYLEGFTVLSRSEVITFELGSHGDWTGTQEQQTEFLGGATDERTHTVAKSGCVTVTEHLDEETDRRTTITAELVSASQRDWTSVAGDEAGLTESFRVTAVDTDDWTSRQSFEADDPGDEVEPNRTGDCVQLGDGTGTCDATIHFESGGAEWATTERSLGGDNTKVWERDFDNDGVNESWGTWFHSYEGAGWAEWTVLRGGEEIDCAGTWDDDTIGTWSCEDGVEGTYPSGSEG